MSFNQENKSKVNPIHEWNENSKKDVNLNKRLNFF